MSVKDETARQITVMSTDDLVLMLQLAIESENKKFDDVHSLALAGAHRFEDRHESGVFFSMIDRVLEPAGDRQYIDALIAELATRVKAAPGQKPAAGVAAAGESSPALAKCKPAGDRQHYARQAMSFLLMATMEIHTRSGTTEQAYDLADKALAAIGALRLMTNGGRVQA